MKFLYIGLISLFLLFSCHNRPEVIETDRLASLFAKYNETTIPEKELENVFHSDRQPDSMEAALILINRFEKETRYKEAEKTAGKAAKLFPENIDLQISYARLAYKTGKDRQFLSSQPELPDSPELSYYSALMEYRQKKSLQSDLVRNFIVNFQSSVFHANFYKIAQKWNLPSFQNDKEIEKQLLTAKALLFNKQYHESAKILLPYSEIQNDMSRATAEDLRLLLLRYKQFSNKERGDLAVRIAEKQSINGSAFILYMTAARLYSLAGEPELASEQTLKANLLAETEEDKDLSLWYQLNNLKNNSLQGEVFETSLRKIAEQWNNPAYFDDIIEELRIMLLESHDNNNLAAMADIMDQHGSDLQTASCAWCAWLLLRESEKKPKTDKLLELAAKKGRWQYEGLAASSQLNKKPFGIESGFPPADTEIDKFILSLLELENHDMILFYIDKYADEITPYVIARSSEYIMKQGYPYESVKLAALNTDFENWNHELLQLNYPVLYNDSILAHSNRYNINPAITKAVIRVESAWNAEIFSHAGAVGLMQLMPSTAADIAEKFDWDSPDLMAPSENILLGTYYLNWLRERDWTSNWIDILAAYNAGGGNLRKWENSYLSSDPLLFVELIPIAETRHYVKKVLTAAYWYSDNIDNFPEDLIYGHL